MKRLAPIAVVLPTLALIAPASAEDVSAPAILQWFEGTYDTIEERSADAFMAGYGGVWLPPPGRPDSGNQSVGYDPYDRFDLGSAGRPTLYGTETGLKTVGRTFDRAGLDLHVDLVINHNGFSDQGDSDFTRSGGYPGFVLQNPDYQGDPNGNVSDDPFGIPNTDGDFHSSFAGGTIDGQISGLLDIDHDSEWWFIRHPVAAGDSRNIPMGTQEQWGRLANRPDPNNARFYTDRQGSHRDVYDPVTRQGGIRIYDFNTDNPMAGDAVEENVSGMLMRNAQWLIQEIGVDHFRVDAMKHVEADFLTELDRAVYRANQRTLLDGSTQHVFMYGEVFDSNRDYLLYGADGQKGNLYGNDIQWNQAKDNFVRKDIDPNDIGKVGGNRDVLDFALRDALRDNLTDNGYANNWTHVAHAGLDAYDDGKMNGSAGVKFVDSHDDGKGAHLNNVAHAYTLLTPGNAVVYFNAREHDSNRDFPKAGRGDALGGMYGNSITKLLEIRNTHGRGDYRERWLDTNEFAFERSKSMLVLLSNRLDGGYDQRRVDVDFAWGETLVELTGNAAAHGDIAELITVDDDEFNGQRKATVRFLRNDGGDRGYLAYGLAAPKSQQGVELTNVDRVLQGGDFNNSGGWSDESKNGKTRLADLHVIKANSFQVKLATQAVTLSGTRLEWDPATQQHVLRQRNIRDQKADGDNALLKIDGGLDTNGNGHVDFVAPGSVEYGFEQFAVRNDGYSAANGNGLYTQTIDTTKLSEGMHFITARAFRHRSDGGPAVFSDFKEVIYVDRLKPISSVASFNAVTQGVNENRKLIAKSEDLTADNIHILYDLPAALSEAQILAMLGSGTQASRTDRNQWEKNVSGVQSGNHVATVVTFELTGTFNVQRFGGLFASTIFGAGLGDADFNGFYGVNDISVFGNVLRSGNTLFNAASDLNGDGFVDSTDLNLLGSRLVQVNADGATMQAYNDLVNGVPEPATLTLLALAAFALSRRPR